MNTENSKANESNKFIYHFTDKLNLINPNNKNIGLFKVFITHGKILNLHTTTINLKHMLQLRVMNLNYLMDHIQSQTFKITLSLLLKNMKL